MNPYIFTLIFMFLFLIEFLAMATFFYLVFLLAGWPMRRLVQSIKNLIRGSIQH